MSDSSEVNIAATNENETEVTEMKDVSTSTGNQNIIVDVKGEAEDEKIQIVAAAGIETKIENYESKRTQRRHFSEGCADEITDDTNDENAEGAVEIDEEEIAEAEEAARIEREEISEAEEAARIEREEISEAKEAARVEKGIVEEWEGVRSQRRHFPGSTTSNIFR